MIPAGRKGIDKMKALAERNIARGDWGEEVGLPWDPMPRTSDDRQAEELLDRVGSIKIEKSE